MPTKPNDFSKLTLVFAIALLAGLAFMWATAGCAPIHFHIGGTYHCDKQVPNSGLVITIPEPENKDDETPDDD